MDASEQIARFKDFLEQTYLAELLERVRKGEESLQADFNSLISFDPDLADALLDHPEDALKASELAVKQFDLPKKITHFKVRFFNLPDSQEIKIRDIRSKHLNKLFKIVGVVRQKSDVRPQTISARFECPSCGNIIAVIQADSQFKEPTKCSCGRKGRFRLLSKELIDAQGIVLEESPDNLDGGEQPKRINVFLSQDLVSPLSEKKTNPGSKITVTGLIKEVPIQLRTGAQSTRFDLILEAINVEAVQDDFYSIEISPEEKKEIIELSQDPRLLQRLIYSLAPSIYGYEKIKEALLIQLVGGVKKTRADKVTTRGDIHIMLVGDPGVAKSQLLKRISHIAPKGRFVSGKGVSGAGLTASVVKDEFLKGWALEAGALVLASNGLCAIDEMDKMSQEDRAAMHEALEGQTITISKANIQATLRAETTVLAAANPKFGRFDPYDLLAKQIELPPTLINRFDLIFPIKDIANKDRDEKMAKHILGLHKDPDSVEQEIETELLRKYLAYSRQDCNPTLTSGAVDEIRNYYVTMRNKDQEEGIRAIPISARQLEALVRMSEASAKLRLAEKVTKKDAKRAIALLQFCLSEVGLDPETGKIDIDRIATGITTSQRSKIFIVKDIIMDLENKLGKTIPIDDIIKMAAEKGIQEHDVEDVIERLKKSGDIFEPRRSFISRI
jgi:replicative DNA helicase Mcm